MPFRFILIGQQQTIYLDSNKPFKIFYASFDSKNLCIVRTTTDLINMVTRVNPLWIPMKKQGSEYVCIISLLKKIYGKHSKVFHKFANASNEFIKLFSL